MNEVVRFVLMGLLREKIGGDAEVRSVAIGEEIKVEIKGVEIERRQLRGWLREIFRCFITRDLPFGFFAHNKDWKELLAVTTSANGEFTSRAPLPSFVTIQAIR